MPGFLIRLAINVLGLWLATEVVSGMRIDGVGTFVAAGLLLGIANALIRPIVVVLTLPITVFSLGLFLLVINAFMLWLVSAMLSDFHVSGFGTAFLGSLIVSLTSWITSWYVGPRGDVQILVVDRQD